MKMLKNKDRLHIILSIDLIHKEVKHKSDLPLLYGFRIASHALKVANDRFAARHHYSALTFVELVEHVWFDNSSVE